MLFLLTSFLILPCLGVVPFCYLIDLNVMVPDIGE